MVWENSLYQAKTQVSKIARFTPPPYSLLFGEEILFRGIIMQGILLIQMAWNYDRGRVLNEEDEKAQQIFRIQVSALIFAAAHLFNTHESLAGYYPIYMDVRGRGDLWLPLRKVSDTLPFHFSAWN